MQTVLVLSSALARMPEAPVDATPRANGAFLAAFEEVGKSGPAPAGLQLGPSAAVLPRVAGRLDPHEPGSMAVALDVAAGGRSALPAGDAAAEKDSQDPWQDEVAPWVVIPMEAGPPAPGLSPDRLADVEGMPDRAANPLAAGPDRKSPGRGPSDQGLAARSSVADAAQAVVDPPDDQMAAGTEPVATAVLKALGELAGGPLSDPPDSATPSASLPPGPGEDDGIPNSPNSVSVTHEPSDDPRAWRPQDPTLQAGAESSRVAAASGRESLAAGPDADALGAPWPSDRHGPAPDPEQVPGPTQIPERFHAPSPLTGQSGLRGTASTHIRQTPASDTPAEQAATPRQDGPAPEPPQAAGVWERAFTSLAQPEKVIAEDKFRPKPDLSVGTAFPLAVGRDGDITLADAATGATGTTVAPVTPRPGGIVPVFSLPLAGPGAMAPALWVLPDETIDPNSYDSLVSPVGSAGAHTAATSAAGATATPGAAGTLPVPQVAAQLLAGLSQGADGSTELALSPDELGHVRLRMEHDATDPERLVVMINFERPETLDLFRRHAGELADALRAAGYSGVDIGFGQGNGEPDDPDRGAPRRGTEPDRPDPAPLAHTAPRPSDGASLDLRL